MYSLNAPRHVMGWDWIVLALPFACGTFALETTSQVFSQLTFTSSKTYPFHGSAASPRGTELMAS